MNIKLSLEKDQLTKTGTFIKDVILTYSILEQ